VPTTLGGFVLFIAFLAPGFAFLLVREQGPHPRPERSVLRETATVVLASLFFDCAAAAGLLIVLALTSLSPPDVSTLISQPTRYLGENLARVAGWFMVLLTGAVLLAVISSGILNRERVVTFLKERPPGKWLLPTSGVRVESAWWKLLKAEHKDSYRRVTCRLEDGWTISGWLRSLNESVEESADREITLSGPFVLTSPQGDRIVQPTGAISVSARRIMYLFVDYLSEEWRTRIDLIPSDDMASPMTPRDPRSRSSTGVHTPPVAPEARSNCHRTARWLCSLLCRTPPTRP
jgi:Family of unknown function (DUF6338)